MGLSLFCTAYSCTSSYSVFITGAGASSVNSSPVASAAILRLLNSSVALAVASTSSTSFGTDFFANTSMGNEMNSEYVFTKSVSLVSSANSSAPSLRWSTMRVPRLSVPASSPPSRIW